MFHYSFNHSRPISFKTLCFPISCSNHLHIDFINCRRFYKLSQLTRTWEVIYCDSLLTDEETEDQGGGLPRLEAAHQHWQHKINSAVFLMHFEAVFRPNDFLCYVILCWHSFYRNRARVLWNNLTSLLKKLRKKRNRGTKVVFIKGLFLQLFYLDPRSVVPGL